MSLDASTLRAAPLAAENASRRLHVVQVLRSLDTGGQEVLCARLVEGLDPERFESTVVSLQGGGWIAGRLTEKGFRVRCLEAPEGFRPELIWQLGGLLRDLRADVVHCHNRKAFLYGGLAAALSPRTRLVFTKHGRSFWDDRFGRALGRHLMRRSAAVIAVSGDIAGPLRSEGWTRNDALHLVLNGVDTDEFCPHGDRRAVREALGLRPEHAVVGTVARLSPEKDQATLLDAFARLAPRLPRARLLLVGDGAQRSALEAQAQELGIADRTLFAGERQDVADLLRAMDLFTLPSLTEGTSLTLLEAMASGLPVVATAVGGNPEVVSDGRSGLLVPPRDPEGLAKAYYDVLTDRARAQAFGAAGREIVATRYSLSAMVRRHAGIYQEICSAGGAHTAPHSTGSEE